MPLFSGETFLSWRHCRDADFKYVCICLCHIECAIHGLLISSCLGRKPIALTRLRAAKFLFDTRLRTASSVQRGSCGLHLTIARDIDFIE